MIYMETFKTLSIQRHTSLYNRLPETRLANNFDKAKANWIVLSLIHI